VTRRGVRGSRFRGGTVRIGLTGPIGCGKSTVAGWLADLGAVVIDADRVAREVTAPGEPALGEVLARFGDGVRAADGSLDRAALGRIVFADHDALRDLEAIVHPAVRPRIVAAIAAAEGARSGERGVVVIEAIKLVEGGLAELSDEVWLVTCDPAAQRARLIGRGSTPGDADQRMGSQGDLAARLRPVASRVIETSGSPDAARQLVRAALDEALAVARSGPPTRLG
jgi:dephospho-CoA kinase